MNVIKNTYSSCEISFSLLSSVFLLGRGLSVVIIFFFLVNSLVVVDALGSEVLFGIIVFADDFATALSVSFYFPSSLDFLDSCFPQVVKTSWYLFSILIREPFLIPNFRATSSVLLTFLVSDKPKFDMKYSKISLFVKPVACFIFVRALRTISLYLGNLVFLTAPFMH